MRRVLEKSRFQGLKTSYRLCWGKNHFCKILRSDSNALVSVFVSGSGVKRVLKSWPRKSLAILTWNHMMTIWSQRKNLSTIAWTTTDCPVFWRAAWKPTLWIWISCWTAMRSKKMPRNPITNKYLVLTYTVLFPFMLSVVTSGLVEKWLKVRRFSLAARPEFHSFVKDRDSGMVLTLTRFALLSFVRLKNIRNDRKKSWFIIQELTSTSLQPPFLQDSPSGILSSESPASLFTTAVTFFISFCNDLAIVGLSLFRGAFSKFGRSNLTRASIGSLVTGFSSGRSMLLDSPTMPVIDSGSSGFTFECLPVSHPGVFKNSVKSVHFLPQQVHPYCKNSLKLLFSTPWLKPYLVSVVEIWSSRMKFATVFRIISRVVLLSTASIVAQSCRHFVHHVKSSVSSWYTDTVTDSDVLFLYLEKLGLEIKKCSREFATSEACQAKSFLKSEQGWQTSKCFRNRTFTFCFCLLFTFCQK